MMMKISTTLFLLLVSLVESKPVNMESNGLLKFESKSQGHKITLCVDGADVCNRKIEMKLNRLFEVDNNGTDLATQLKTSTIPISLTTIGALQRVFWTIRM